LNSNAVFVFIESAIMKGAGCLLLLLLFLGPALSGGDDIRIFDNFDEHFFV